MTTKTITPVLFIENTVHNHFYVLYSNGRMEAKGKNDRWEDIGTVFFTPDEMSNLENVQREFHSMGYETTKLT